LLSRSSEDTPTPNEYESTQRLISTPPEGDGHNFDSPAQSETGLDHKVARNLQTGAVYRQGTTASRYPGETQNPYGYSQPQAAGSYGQHANSSPAEELYGAASQPSSISGRGVNLVDPGPVSSGESVRRLARPGARRPSSTVQSASERYSRVASSPSVNSPGGSLTMRLPPGAAPPRSGSNHGGY
jgi:chitin synthase